MPIRSPNARTSIARRAAAAAAIIAVTACLAAAPSSAAAQSTANSRRGVLAPILGGGASGIALAFAMIDQPGEAWLVDDAAVLPTALTLGVAAALFIRSQSTELASDDVRRPRLQATIGGGGDMGWDASLGYRAPVRDRGELGGMLLVINATRETSARETRCDPMIGCFTADFIVGYRYVQSVAAVGRASYRLRPGAALDPAFAIAAGPILLHAESSDASATRRAGLLLDAALTMERGRRSRWIAEAGYRVVAGGGRSDAGLYRGGWTARGGWAFGY